MSESVVLPALGESVTEGTVTRWLKNVGDRVEVDEPLLEVSTDKVDTEVPSPIAGVLEEILVQEDETAEVGAVLAKIGDGSGSAASPAPAADSAEQPDAPVSPATPEAPEAPAAEVPPADAAASQAAPAASSDAQDVVLPSLGESVTEGTVTRWLKNVGDSVDVDEALLEISTDKVDTEVPSPVAGVLQEMLVAEDETVEIGAVLARIGSGASSSAAAEQAPAPQTTEQAAPKPSTPTPPATETPSAAEVAPVETKSETAQVSQPTPAEPNVQAASSYVTPIVRKLAAERGVDLSSVTGSGVGGRIRKEDVLAAAERASSAPAGDSATTAVAPAPVAEISPLRGTTQSMSRLRKVIAQRAVESMQATAQLTTMVEVDVTRVARLREAKKAEFLEKSGSKLSFLPFFALAAAEALRSYPIINATVEGDTIVYPDTENLSIAVDTERGLLTPVVRDAAEKTLAQLSQDIADLAERTRNNKLTPDELAGGTFTLTNTGSRGALFDTPLVFLPQVAILGTGTVVKRAVVMSGTDGDSIAIRSMVYLALSYDHRIVDGADAARFLTQVKHRLEEGNFEGNLGI